MPSKALAASNSLPTDEVYGVFIPCSISLFIVDLSVFDSGSNMSLAFGCSNKSAAQRAA